MPNHAPALSIDPNRQPRCRATAPPPHHNAACTTVGAVTSLNYTMATLMLWVSPVWGRQALLDARPLGGDEGQGPHCTPIVQLRNHLCGPAAITCASECIAGCLVLLLTQTQIICASMHFPKTCAHVHACLREPPHPTLHTPLQACRHKLGRACKHTYMHMHAHAHAHVLMLHVGKLSHVHRPQQVQNAVRVRKACIANFPRS